MKHLRAVLFLAASLVIVRSATADDIHIIFDPTPPTLGSFYLIQNPGTEYTVNWVSCTSSGIPAAMSGDAACLPFLNETGGSITSLDFSFTVNSALVGQTITCTNLDASLTHNDCGAFSPLTLGENVSVNFSGGMPIPNFMAFFIAEDGVPLADAPTVGVSVSAAEPPTLPLLSLGLGLMGLMWGGLKLEKIVAS